MNSILRSGLLDHQRRRYVLSYDSGYILCRRDVNIRVSRRSPPSTKIISFNNYQSLITQRPVLKSFECILHTVYQLGAHEYDTHLLHLLHILQVIKICGLLARERAQTSSAALQDDEPILQFKPNFLKKFTGPTIYHWTIRRFYLGLTRTARPISGQYYMPTCEYKFYYQPVKT